MARESLREVGGYRLLGTLGAGGMGAVYRAIDGDGRVVALKLLHAHLDGDPEARERLRREVESLQRVRHRGVARVLDAEIDSAEAFLVTELVAGRSLAEQVRAAGPLDPPELAELAEQLHDALAVVHRAGVLHRDLTPGNVMLTDDGPVLIDFGIAQSIEDSRVTSAGLVAGTPGYVAPELLAGGEPSAAGDWWGWAVLLTFAATGRSPFGRGSARVVLARARAGDADLDGLDPRTAAALHSALAPEPWRRAAPERVLEDLMLAASGVTDLADETEVIGQTKVFADSDTAWDTDDLWLPDGADEVEELPAVPGPRRAGTLLAVGFALAAVGGSRPGVALLTAVGLVVLAHSFGLDVEALHRRRNRRGDRRADRFGAVVGWPWYLFRAVVGVLPAVVLGLSLVVVLGGLGWWLLGTGRVVVPPPAGQSPGPLAGNAAWVLPALLAASVLAGVVGMWFGPLGRSTRVGGRWLAGVVAPGRSGAVAVVVLVIAAAAAALLLAGPEVFWWPLPGPPAIW